jgi:hypothetical protein
MLQQRQIVHCILVRVISTGQVRAVEDVRHVRQAAEGTGHCVGIQQVCHLQERVAGRICSLPDC